jgi:hypothetical protein
VIQNLHRLENELEAALREEANFKNLNAGYLGNYGSDCNEVDRLLSELSLKAPDTVPDTDKKMTAQDRTAWLKMQRTENTDVAAAINRQESVTFNLENLKINAEMAKKKLETLRAVLALKTAQIQFLTNE